MLCSGGTSLREACARILNPYVFELTFCNLASGWEKGQVEKNVQDARPRLWQPMPNFSDLGAERLARETWRGPVVRDPARSSAWHHRQCPGRRTGCADAAAARLRRLRRTEQRVSPTWLISFEPEEDQETIRGIVSPDARLHNPLTHARMCCRAVDGADRLGSDGPGGVYQALAAAAWSRSRSRGVGAQEGKERYGAAVVSRERETQSATECLRARGFDPDPILDPHTGPRQVPRHIIRPDTCQHPTARQTKLRRSLLRRKRLYMLREGD